MSETRGASRLPFNDAIWGFAAQHTYLGLSTAGQLTVS